MLKSKGPNQKVFATIVDMAISRKITDLYQEKERFGRFLTKKFRKDEVQHKKKSSSNLIRFRK